MTRRSPFRADTPDEMKLTVLRKENPKRLGSIAHGFYEKYPKDKPTTVAGALRAGVRWKDIRNDAEKGFIKLG